MYVLYGIYYIIMVLLHILTRIIEFSLNFKCTARFRYIILIDQKF